MEGPEGLWGRWEAHLHVQLARAVAKGLQPLRMAPHTLQIPHWEAVLGVEEGNHSLQQLGPEVAQGLIQARLSPLQVASELHKEALEEARMLSVKVPVGAGEHVLHRALGSAQQLPEEICRREGGRREGEKGLCQGPASNRLTDRAGAQGTDLRGAGADPKGTVLCGFIF